MAEIKTVKINVDTQSAVSAMDNLSKATHDVSQSFEQVYGDLQPLTTRMGEAEDRLYELANAGKTTTKEYKDLLKTVGNYRKVQINTDLAVDAAATTMSQKLGGALGGATAGFSVVTGVMGTFGVESEEIEKLLLRVNAAMAMAQGLQGLKEAKPAFIDLGKTIAKIPAVQKLAALGQRALNAVMAANPIGLIIAAITALIATGAALFAWFSSVSEATQRHTKLVDANRKALDRQTIALKDKATEADRAMNQELAMAKASGMSAKAIRALELKLIDEKIARERSTKATLLDTYETNKNSLAKLRAAGADEDLIKKQLETTAKAGENILKQNDNIKAALSEKKDIQNRHLVEIETAEVQANKESSQRAKEAGDNARLRQKEANDKKKQDAADYRKLEAEADEKAKELQLERERKFEEEIEALDEQNFQNRLKSSMSEEAYELELVRQKYWALEEAAKDNAEQLAIITTAKETELKAITDKYKVEKEAADKATSDKEIADAKAVADKKKELKINAVSSGLSVISNLAELFAGKSERQQKQAFKIQKTVNIATAVVDTYKAANAALASAPVPFNFVAMAATISAGLLNIKKIASTEFGGGASTSGGSVPSAPNSSGGGSGGVSGGGGQQQAPQFNVVGNSGINQLAQLQQQPTQAYVVSGAVTSAQSLDRNRVQNATIG